MPATLRANSITAACIPRHIPKNGILFSLAYLTAQILPSMPRDPNPPGTSMPSAIPRVPAQLSSSIFSESTNVRFTLQSLEIPPWDRASFKLLYDSVRSTYFPTIAMLTEYFGFLYFSTSSSQASSLGALVQIWSCSTILSSSPSLRNIRGTS